MNQRLTKDIITDLRDAWHVSKKSLYKTSEFQILFKTIYVSILLFVMHFITSVVLHAIEMLVIHAKHGEEITAIPLTTLINEAKIASVLAISFFTTLYIYHVEKNGVMIITAEYYRNAYITFFHALFRAMQRTPLFIMRRLKELHVIIYLLIGTYVFRYFLSFTHADPVIISGFTAASSVLTVILFFSTLFRHSFTSHITCLAPDESPDIFNKNITKRFRHKKMILLILFYTTFTCAVALFCGIFYLCVHSFVIIMDLHTPHTSFIFAFFVACTIVSIVIFLSLFKTFKSSMMTILYYQQRKQQRKNITILPDNHPPLLSHNVTLALCVLITIIMIGGGLLTTSIKLRTDAIILHTTENTQPDDILSHVTPPHDMLTHEELIHQLHSRNAESLHTVEKIVLTYLIYITH